MIGPRIGSLCTGYGGLDMAVQQVLGGRTAWVADIDPGASKILAHRYPGVPNLSDLTTTDWAAVEPVDIVCGGYPCQPFSSAGLRKGVEDERHIWPYIATALRVLRPRVAIFENVAGHLRRGFDTVLADLAGLGFDVEWATVRASEVGAPHRRERLFILATATDASGDGRHEGRPESAGIVGGPDVALGGSPALADAPRLRYGHARPAGERGVSAAALAGDPADREWGAYGPAIARWEHAIGRTAPQPTEPGRTGERLSPAFVEWMQGLRPGWVTQVPGLTRNQQLHALGNGVIPAQAAYALQLLLERGLNERAA